MPDAVPPPLAIFVAAVFVLAGVVKGVIGLGLPTVAIGLIGIVMPPAQAAALLIVPSLLTNLWQIVGPGWIALLRRLAPLLAGVCVGVALGAGWLAAADAARTPWAGIGLGLALSAYAALGLLAWRPRVPAAHEAWLSPLIGLATGLVTAATGVFVIPAVPYLQALGLAKDDLVRSLGISFLISTIALALGLGHGGVLRPPELLASLLAVPPALVGMAFGQWLRSRLAPELFRRCFLVGLLLLGTWLALRALTQV